MANRMLMIPLRSLVTHPRLPMRTMYHLFVRLSFFTVVKATRCRSTRFNQNIHQARGGGRQCETIDVITYDFAYIATIACNTA